MKKFSPGQRVRVDATDDTPESLGTIIKPYPVDGLPGYIVLLDATNERDLVHPELIFPLRDENPMVQFAQPPLPVPAWLEEVYVLRENKKLLKAGQLLFREFDALLRAGQFEECDEILLVVDVEKLDTNLLVVLLGATKCPALQNRPILVRRIEGRLRQLAPDRYTRLMKNLA